MSDELSAILRAAARDEASAAEDEFPYSSAVLDRYVGDVRRRRAAGMATLAVATVTVVGLAALGVGQLLPTGPTVVSPLPAATSSASPAPSVTPTPTVEPSTTPAPSPTPDPSPSSTPTTPSLPTTAPPPPPPSKTPTVAAPGPVTGVKGSTGGGSGETMVTWDQGADATGYRVYLSDSVAGPFVVAATFDVVTGTATIAPAFANDYVIIGAYGEVAPHVLYYVDAIGDNAPTYYRVAAFTSGGEGLLSPVVCATPPFSSFTC